MCPITQSTICEPVGFAALNLRPALISALSTLGHETPTPIQCEAIPPLLLGRDLLGQAATGTGKTAAFALPILERVDPARPAVPVALVLVPTRELATQVAQAFGDYGRDLGARCVAVYGGQPIRLQIDAIRRGCHVIVATPGRALDHIRRGTLPLGALEVVVLDEADEMLDLGFAEDLDAILEALPKTRQTVLFSATVPARVETIARRQLTDPARIRIGATVTSPGEAPQVRESAYVVHRQLKPAALARILRMEAPTAAIVFCPTRRDVDSLTETLQRHGFQSEALHGGMEQEQRDRVMGRFRRGAVELLLATDVAARGLDIDHLTHVVNFDVPRARESYVHRIGRVGRAGRSGVAITLVEPRERRQLGYIEQLTGRRIAVEPIPTPAALREKQLDRLFASIREVVDGEPGELEHLKSRVEALAAQSDPLQVALAAVSLLHAGPGAVADDVVIPDLSSPSRRPAAPVRERGGPARPGRRDAVRASSSVDTARLYVAAGASAGVRAGDLVGAIASESPLSGTDIGAIEVQNHFSLVEVPASTVDDVIRSMARTMIRGRKAKVRRFVESPRRPGTAPRVVRKPTAAAAG